MMLDLLFVNGRHPEFPYIPMGTFGLVDHLDRHGMNSRILNLGLYAIETGDARLVDMIERGRPRYVGLILHWKELLTSCIRTGALIRRHFPTIPIVAGGLTASSFAPDLMSSLGFIDYIVVGDAEAPLLDLLRGETPPTLIPNLTHRDEGAVRQNRISYVSTAPLLDSLSFSRLDALEDYGRYLDRIDDYLGFPILVGRGCAFDCEYCGGSRSAFARHSGRYAVARRSIAKIVEDVTRLRQDYRCNHILLSHLTAPCKQVLRALLDRPEFEPPLRVNLEIWDEPDAEVVSLQDALAKRALRKPSILITFKSGPQRPADPSAASRLDEIVAGVEHCHVDLFKGYFTSEHVSLETLFADLGKVHRLRTRHAQRDLSVHLLALSTDPGSRIAQALHHFEVRLSLPTINRAILFDRNLSTNMLLHRPASLSAEDQQRFETTLAFTELLFSRAPLVYWLLTGELGFDAYLAVAHDAARHFYWDLAGVYYDAAPAELVHALNVLKRSLAAHDMARPLLIDAVEFSLAREVARRLRRARPPRTEGVPSYVTLNWDRVFVAQHDFTRLLAELAESGRIRDVIRSEVAVDTRSRLYLLTDADVREVPMGELPVLTMFDGVHDTETIVARLSQMRESDADWIRCRVADLYQEELVIEG